MKLPPSRLGGFALQRSYFTLRHLALEHGREVLMSGCVRMERVLLVEQVETVEVACTTVAQVLSGERRARQSRVDASSEDPSKLQLSRRSLRR